MSQPAVTTSPRSAVGEVSSWVACSTIAKITFRRTMRSRSLIIALVISFLPVLLAVALSQAGSSHSYDGERIVACLQLVMIVIAPLLLASSVAEEIEERTFTYLWSRPIPRWSVVVGKFLFLAPVAVLLPFLGSLLANFIIASTGVAADDLWSSRGVILGVLSLALFSSGIGMLLPTIAQRFCYGYLFLVDLPIGGLPISLKNISLTYHARELTKLNVSATEHVVWLAGMAAAFLLLGFLRLRRAEYSTDK